MRKLLLGTTALATAFSASAALAQPSIKGGYEFTYVPRFRYCIIRSHLINLL